MTLSYTAQLAQSYITMWTELIESSRLTLDGEMKSLIEYAAMDYAQGKSMRDSDYLTPMFVLLGNARA